MEIRQTSQIYLKFEPLRSSLAKLKLGSEIIGTNKLKVFWFVDGKVGTHVFVFKNPPKDYLSVETETKIILNQIGK